MKTIALCKDNLLENEREVSYEEIYNGLLSYKMFTKHYPKNITFENCLLLYLSNADGLSSTYECRDFENLKNYCYSKFKNFGRVAS